MSFELGRTYSGYEFLEIANQTGTTVAYRVRNTLADRLELLHVLSQTAENDPQRRERFMREMRLRARLLHPNIPGFLNATELNGHLVLTTELIEGRPLAEKLKQGPLLWREACRITVQILSALACAHEFDIVHRDISPDTVWITPDGSVEISNFGMAKGLSSPQLTQAGSIFGNAAYISPEQARGSMDVDCRSDVYSVGALLFHMLCGRPPFVAKSEFELMLAHVREEPQPPSAFHAGVPQPLDAVVLRALAKEPAQRYATAAEFAESLAAASRAPVDARPSIPAMPDGVSQSKRPIAYGAGAVLAIVLMLVWWFVRK